MLLHIFHCQVLQQRMADGLLDCAPVLADIRCARACCCPECLAVCSCGLSIVQPAKCPLAASVFPAKVKPDDVLRNAATPPVAMAMGFPCVDISIAGNRQGFDASHSSLWRQAWALAMGLKLKYILFENVANIATKSMRKVFQEVQRTTVNCTRAQGKEG